MIRRPSDRRGPEIDQRIAIAWEGHPRRFIVESTVTFLDKARQTIALLREELPRCCRKNLATPASQASP